MKSGLKGSQHEILHYHHKCSSESRDEKRTERPVLASLNGEPSPCSSESRDEKRTECRENQGWEFVEIKRDAKNYVTEFSMKEKGRER